MEIGSILQRSWDIAWRYKSLWIFGLFIESLGGFNGIFRGSDSDSLRSFTANPAFLALLGLGVVVGLIFLVMHFISSAAHIDAVNKLTRGGVYTFGSSFSVGVDHFLRFLGMGLLMFGAVIVLVIVLAIPGVLLFFVHWTIGILGLMVLVPAFIAAMASLLIIYWMAQRAVVVRGSGISDALDEGYFLFRTYLGHCIKFALVLLLISIVVGIAILTVIAIIAAPFVAMAIATEGGLIPALLFGIPAVLLVMLVVDGLYGSFFHASLTLFYFGLLDIPLANRQSEPGAYPVTE